MRGCWLLSVIWLGCPAHEAAPPEHAMSAQLTLAVQEVTASCPLGAPPSVPERDSVFVEALVFDVPSAIADAASLMNAARLVQEPGVRLLAGPHLVADMERESAFTLVDVQGYSEEATLHAVSLTPHRADDTMVLDLALTLQLPNPRRATPNPTREVRLRLASRNDAPLVASAAWEPQAKRSLMVVLQGHSVRAQEDLRRIFECKMRRRAESLRPRSP
jgi:hypothetical protein